MIFIDGSYLSGGGQILRTALSLSMITQTPFEMMNIRAGRSKPGIKPQHLQCIHAFHAISKCKTEHAEVGSNQIKFIPASISEHSIVLDVGTAGSLTLILQSLLPALLFFERRMTIDLTGGTDVAWSPQTDYFEQVILPHFRPYAEINYQLMRRGYYPKGYGKIRLIFEPKFSKEELRIQPSIELMDRGPLENIEGIAHASVRLKQGKVVERMIEAATVELSDIGSPNFQTDYRDTLSPGAGMTCWATYSSQNPHPVIIGSDVLGERRVSAENVGRQCAAKLKAFMESGSPVDPHLADNLIPLLGLFGGRFKTVSITDHTKTNIWLVENFLEKRFSISGNVITAQ